MIREAELADGTILEFPDDTTDEVIDRTVKAHLSAPNFANVDSRVTSQQIPPTASEEAQRQLGLTARHAIEGTAQTIGIFSDPLAAMGNAVLPGQPFGTAAQVGTSTADMLGLPQPQGATERIVGGVSRALVGGGGFTGAGRALANAPGAVGAVGASLAAKPGSQAVASVTGGTAAEVARESGVGPWGQMAAGIAGGLAPSGVAASFRGAARGGEVGRQNMLANIEAFERAGAGTPTVAQATEGRIARGAEALLERAPGGAGVMARTADREQAGMGQRVREVADSLSTKASPEQAGRGIERGIRGEGGFLESFKAQQEQLFDRLDNYIPADQRIDISSTKSALSSLNSSIPGAPNTSRLFQNGRIAGISQALDNDLAISTAEQDALGKALARIDDLYASRNSATQTSGQLRALANQQANRTDQFYPVPGQPRIPGRYSGFPERAAQANTAADEARGIARDRAAQAMELEATVADLQRAAAASGGKLPYEAIKKLRTLVGQEMADSGLMSDVPRSKWKALYGALSRDLETAARGAGPEAARAFSRANNYTRVGMGRLEAIDSVIEKNGGPESVFRAALSGSREGATTLRAVMQSLPADAKRQLSAAVLRRMGRANPSAQDDVGEAFSSETFLSNWNKLAPEAKVSLFGRFGPSYVRDMEAIAKAASSIRQGAQVFRNPAGTAQAATQIATVGSLILSVASGNLPTAGYIAGGIASANVMARVLTKPEVVKWIAEQTKMPLAALPIQIARLKAEAQAGGDEETLEFARAVESAAEQAPGR